MSIVARNIKKTKYFGEAKIVIKNSFARFFCSYRLSSHSSSKLSNKFSHNVKLDGTFTERNKSKKKTLNPVRKAKKNCFVSHIRNF